MAQFQDLDGGTQADISHHIRKHYTNSLEWLKHTVREYYGCEMTDAELMQQRANAQVSDLRRDGICSSLPNTEPYFDW